MGKNYFLTCVILTRIIISLNIHVRVMRFKRNVNNIHMEGIVSQILKI